MFDNEFPPLGGGTGVVNYHLFREFATYPEITVDLVTSSRTRSTYETEQFSDRIMVHKVPVDNRNIHHARNIELIRYSHRGLLAAQRLLAQRRYDLSFAFAGVPAGAISYLLKRRYGLPYLVSLQGPDVPGFEQRYASLYPLLKPLLRRVWRNAEAVIAISAEHRRLAHAFMSDIEIPVIFNGVDTTGFRPPDSRSPQRYCTIVCVGRLIERKGQHHLLHAAAILKRSIGDRFRVMIVGTGDFERELRRECDRLQLNDLVSFSGVIPREAMPAVYQESDLFVLPSHNEGMSIALLEAMASGLPVVVTDTGGVEELVREGENGMIVTWADREGLARAMQKIITDAELRNRMGRASLKRASAFGWPAIARDYLRLFEQVVRTKTSHQAA